MPPRILPVDPWNPEPGPIAEAAEILLSGGLVAFPTETVYGLGANGLDPCAAAKIFAAKGRPADNPLILHFAAPDAVDEVALVPSKARRLMELFWPGPLTLVLPSKGTVPPEVTAGLDSVAVRMPSHPAALALLARAKIPVAAPSANSSGRPSPTDAPAVASDLGDGVNLILDGGETSVGVESTVLDATGEQLVLLRPGGCAVEEIEARSGMKVLLSGGAAHRSPGTRYRHYAPRVPLLLDTDADGIARAAAKADGALRIAWIGMHAPEISLGEGVAHPGLRILFDSPENYARGLFHALRVFEERGAGLIAAQWPPSEEGIGRALRDRLMRASMKE